MGNYNITRRKQKELSNINPSKKFFNLSPKAQVTKGKQTRVHSTQESLCDRGKGTGASPCRWRVDLLSHTAAKGSMSKMDAEL